MKGKPSIAQACLWAALLLACGTARAGDEAPSKTPPPDVTITVIPAGQNVLKTVVQVITVPPAAGAHKAGPQIPGPTTQQPASHNAAQMPPGAEEQIEHAARQAERQAAQAAENQAEQAKQAQQQAQALSHQQPHPPPPPPPPGPPKP